MKRIAFILILIGFCGINNTHAESGYTFSSEPFSLLNKFENGFEQSLPNLLVSTVDSGEADHNPFSKKGKKRKKAIKPIAIYISDEQHLKNVDPKIALIYSPETFYLFCPYFGDDERGPPVAVAVF